jgi:hypothetical protein
MKNKALLSELERQIKLLESHITRLMKEPEKLHDLDVEVMGDKIKEIYALVNDLETRDPEIVVKAPVVQEVEKVPMVEVKPEPEIPVPSAPDVSSEIEEERGPKNEERETKTEERGFKTEERGINTEGLPVKEEPALPRAQPPVPDPEPPSPSPVPRPPDPEPQQETPEPKTTADLFSGPTTIADKFQDREDNSIAAKVNPQPAQDLKMAIGINDKFLFINELFQGDPSVYNMAIENVNAAGGLDDALQSINTYREKYQWADNSEAYHRLKKIVNTKFNG